MSDDRPTPRTGITWRRPERPTPAPRSTDPRVAWALVLGALVVGAVGLAWVFGWGPTDDDRPTIGAASPSPAPGVTTTPTVPPATERPAATEAAPTEEPTATAVPSPVPTLGRPSPTPSAPASPGAPTPASPSGLAIDFPADGETVISRVINVIGTGPPGATITRDIPLWFDDHTTVRDDGLWMLRVELSEGPNDLTLRIGDDRSTERRITVIYQADG